MVMTITEISDRSSDGRTFPFMCRCEDGERYYVKGQSANHRSLVCEWIGGQLAESFGLNIPPRAIAQAPASLVRLHPEGRDLGTGFVFASRAIENLNWVTYSSVQQIPREVRRDVLVFDWWVHNADRTLTASGGNPNLLFDAASRKLVVIDHNLAFDPDFDPHLFFETHIFRDEWESLCQDLVEMANYQTRLKQALDEAWPVLLPPLPGEWMFHDDEQTIPIDFSHADCLAFLERCTAHNFWRLA